MKHFALLMFGFVVSLSQISGQTTIISSKPARWTSATLDSTFSRYEIFTISTKALKECFSSKEKQKSVSISIAEKTWTLNAESAGICPVGTPLQIDKAQSRTTYDPTFKGFTQQGLPFRLTINDDFFAGMLPLNNQEFYIEPLKNFDSRAENGLFVVYEKKDIIARSNRKCLVKDINEHYKSNMNSNFRTLENCAVVELAVATDVSMYQKYSASTTAVQNRVTSIMNLVEGLYQTSFSHKIKFTIVTWFQSTGADPWTGSTSAGNVLDSFSTWGPNGFNVNYDLGQFWTNRNFDGSTIGIAWVGGVCANKFRHHAVQDFSTSDAFMRCMVAHEIGHNFDMSHNTDIMAPSVSASTTWSATSIAQINSFLPSVLGPSCLAPCSSGGGGGSTGAPPVANFSIAANDTFCINKQIQFEDKSLNNPYTYKWTFEGGTPAISALSDPKVLYKNPGTYAVSLEVTNAYGTNTKTINIIAVAIPIVTFSYQINALSVAFTNTSTGPATWAWKFGDGKTSTQKNPTHTYSNNGSFNAQLTATNTCGSKIASKIVPVFAATPVAAFSVSTGSGCTPFIIQLNNSSTNAQSYEWQLPGAQSTGSFEKNPTVVYNTPGIFEIKLIAFNGTLSDTLLLKNAVKVSAVPSIAFNSFVYAGGLTQFKNQTKGASTLKWEFGDGTTSKDSIPLHYYLKSGTYTVRLSASNACGTVTIEKSISILLPPIARFTADSVYSSCKNVKIRLQNTSSADAEEFVWLMPAANPDSSHQKNPEFSFSNSGIYTIKLIAKNSVGIDSFSQKIKIDIKQDPISAFSDSISLLNVFFRNRSDFANSYEWDFGDGQKSNAFAPSHTYANDGIYEVRLKAKNECDSAFAFQTIVVYSLPKAGFSYTTDSLCAKTTLNFKQEVSLNTQSLFWHFEGGSPLTSGSANPTITYDSAGIYSVSLIAKNPAGRDSLYKKDYVKIEAKPIAAYTVIANGLELSFKSTSSRAKEYEWDFGDGTTSTQVDPTHIFKQKGVYIVQLTVRNECGSSAYKRGISLDFVDSKDVQNTEAFNVYPNPSSGQFTIDIPESIHDAIEIIVRNVLGQEVYRNQVTKKEKGLLQTIDIAGSPKGNYILELSNNNKRFFTKIVIE